MSHCHPHHIKKEGEHEATERVPDTMKIMLVCCALIGLAALLIFSKTGALSGFRASVNDAAREGNAMVTVEPQSIDLGTVAMSQGIVERTFAIKNSGTGPLRISDLQTSCMCTSAQLEVSGKKSPVFGMAGHGGGHHGSAGAAPKSWSMEIPSGEEGTLRVFYDPNAHGPTGTGPFRREIMFRTNDAANQEVTLTIFGTVVR